MLITDEIHLLLAYYFILLVFIGLKVGPEYVVAVLGCSKDHLAVVGVETKLFNVRLTLMQEHQLWGNVLLEGLLLCGLIYFD